MFSNNFYFGRLKYFESKKKNMFKCLSKLLKWCGLYYTSEIIYKTCNGDFTCNILALSLHLVIFLERRLKWNLHISLDSLELDYQSLNITSRLSVDNELLNYMKILKTASALAEKLFVFFQIL